MADTNPAARWKRRRLWLAAPALLLAAAAVLGWFAVGRPTDSPGLRPGEHRPALRFLRRNDRGLQEYVHEATGIVLVRLPGGRFRMGSPPGEIDREPGERRHEVELSPFLIGRTEVTNAQFRHWRPDHPAGDDDLPVVGVDWDTAASFCRDHGLTLPSEAQWEYAARSGDDREFPWGSGWPPPQGAGNYDRNVGCDGYRKLCPVERFSANGFGLFDLGGNALEWCRDRYAGDYADAPTLDPLGPEMGPGRVARGGSYLTGYRRDARCAARDQVLPERRYGFLGFRVVCLEAMLDEE